MQQTTNYGLSKPEENDVADIEVLNQNADKIDAELKKLSTEKVSADDLTNHSADTTKHIGTAAKATPVDADSLALVDSADGSKLKRLTWANLKARLSGILLPASHAASATTYGVGTASTHGHVKLSDATNSTSGEIGATAATPAAVKVAYDLANGKADASHTHSGVYEPVFTKNSAFNKVFETLVSNIKMNGTAAVGSSDNVARADHIHPVDTSRAAASHTHTIANVTGLQTTLNEYTKFVKGYYVGDGTSLRTISTPFTPKFVFIIGANDVLSYKFNGYQMNNSQGWYQSYTNNTYGCVTNGFVVDAANDFIYNATNLNTNRAGYGYHYYALG